MTIGGRGRDVYLVKRVLPLLLLAAAPASSGSGLERQVAAELTAASPGTRFGLVVATADGREIIALLPDQRFVPASTVKLFTIAALFASGIDLDAADADGGTSVRLDPRPAHAPDVVLVGHGDPRLSGAPDCVTDCLATLADAVAARARVVGDVVGDDSWFPDQRWSPGMSWNNMATASGTAVSALSIDDDEVALVVAPGAAPTVADGYYAVEDRTVAGAVTALGYDRLPGSDRVRLTGTVAAGGEQHTLRLGVDDPAHHAAFRLAAMLRTRGVRVLGNVVARHRPADAGDDPARRGSAAAARPPESPTLARLVAPPLLDTATVAMKRSQNLYAELLLRRVGRLRGTGSIADGQAAVAGTLRAAGVPRVAYDLTDGSGMSSYDRVSPRGVITFLRWAMVQPWGARWRATLPVAGEGTLRRRFAAGPLAGRIAAKTGTLNGSDALAGFMTAASGRELVFAAYANDVPNDAGAARAIDAALARIAVAN